MKKQFLLLIPLLLLSQSCVNTDYDLNKLDSSMTLIPGLTIPINVESSESLSLLNDVLKNSDDLAVSETGDIVIKESSPVEVSIAAEDITEQTRIEITDIVTIPVQKALNQLLKGMKLTIPRYPVIEVFNPVDYGLQLTGKAKLGNDVIEFGPIPVASGQSRVELTDSRIKDFMSPVKGDIVIFDMVIEGFKSDTNSIHTKAPEVYVFTIAGILDLTLSKGDVIDFDYEVGDVSQDEIRNFSEEFGIEFKSCTVNVEITNNTPFEFSATASGNSGAASASTNGTVAPGSLDKPVTSKIAVSLDLPSGVQDINNITVSIHAVASQTPSTINKDHTLNFKLVDVVFSDGVSIDF